MNSLREMLRFVGIPGAARLFTATGTPIIPTPALRTIGTLVPLLGGAERTSLRTMGVGLRNLPPISLEAEAENTVGDAPLRPEVRVQPSQGVILETRAAVYQGGTLLDRSDTNLGSAGGSAGYLTLDAPGSYRFEVARTGIPNTGIQVLIKSFNVIVKTPPSPTTGQGGTAVRPTLTSVTSAAGKFQVKGNGFLKSHAVQIRVVNDATLASNTFPATSDGSGNLDATLTIPMQTPGTVLDFSATDDRTDPSDRTGTLWSNTFRANA